VRRDLPSVKRRRLAGWVLGLTAAAALGAAASPASRVEVSFDHPEKFTDVKDADIPSVEGRDAILGKIRAFLVSSAGPRIPEGDKLTIIFTDIDLAGEFEPRHSGPNNPRVLTENYPPAFDFTFSVTDASGKVVREGSEHLRDAGYLLRASVDSIGSLRYEKDILEEWARARLRDLPRP
jgi:hypothetical protein